MFGASPQPSPFLVIGFLSSHTSISFESAGVRKPLLFSLSSYFSVFCPLTPFLLYEVTGVKKPLLFLLSSYFSVVCSLTPLLRFELDRVWKPLHFLLLS